MTTPIAFDNLSPAAIARAMRERSAKMRAEAASLLRRPAGRQLALQDAIALEIRASELDEMAGAIEWKAANRAA